MAIVNLIRIYNSKECMAIWRHLLNSALTVGLIILDLNLLTNYTTYTHAFLLLYASALHIVSHLCCKRYKTLNYRNSLNIVINIIFTGSVIYLYVDSIIMQASFEQFHMISIAWILIMFCVYSEIEASMYFLDITKNPVWLLHVSFMQVVIYNCLINAGYSRGQSLLLLSLGFLLVIKSILHRILININKLVY